MLCHINYGILVVSTRSLARSQVQHTPTLECTHVYVHVCKHAYVHACTHVCTHICTRACAHVCAHVCTHTCHVHACAYSDSKIMFDHECRQRERIVHRPVLFHPSRRRSKLAPPIMATHTHIYTRPWCPLPPSLPVAPVSMPVLPARLLRAQRRPYI